MTNRLLILGAVAALLGAASPGSAQVTGVNTPPNSNQPLYLGSNGNVDMMIDANGNIGVGAGTQTTNPSYSLNVNGAISGTNATANANAIYGIDTSTGGNAVFGTSTNGWGGNFEGAGGVYGANSSTSAWAGMFESGSTINGVWIDNPAHNTWLCLNGVCTTTLALPTLYSCPANSAASCNGAWASFGCTGQITTMSYCTNYTMCSNGLQAQNFACTPLN